MMLLMSMGLMFVINAVFDTVILVVRFTHLPGPIFGKELGWWRNALHAALILGPVLELVGAALIWWLYQDLQQYELPEHENRFLLGGGAPRAPPVRSFSGVGRRLGD